MDKANTAAEGEENQALKAALRNTNRNSAASFSDVADRHLKDKTDAIAHIIRNIAEQCHAAVEGLQIAQESDLSSKERSHSPHTPHPRRSSTLSTSASDDGVPSAVTSETGDDFLHPSSGRASSIPPTPDLIPNRSSTSMSFNSTATTPERGSQQFLAREDIPTKIVEDDAEDFEAGAGSESDVVGGHHTHHSEGVVGKQQPRGLIHRPSGARISALGGTR